MNNTFRILKSNALFLSVILLFGVSACKGDKQSADAKKDVTQKEQPAKKQVKIPKFDKSSAYKFVEKQVAFGPRTVNSQAHEDCKNWMVAKLKEYGAEVIEQDFTEKAFDGTKLKATNIIGQFNVDNPKRIVLAAHWDSRPFADSPLSKKNRDKPILGADDGGSGVGILLEIARQIHEHPIDLGVDIVFFDAEDYGNNTDDGKDHTETWALGSQYWSKHLHRPNYKPKYGILLDLVGGSNPRFGREGISMQAAPVIMTKVWRLAQSMGYGNSFVDANTGSVTDDHYFVILNAGIPMIDIINKPADSRVGFPEHWHTHNDNMDAIDKWTLNTVGQVILAVVYRENNGTF